MTGFKSDNLFEIDLNKMLVHLENLKKTQTIFMSTHNSLPQKEKLLAIQSIHRDQKIVATFIEKAKQEENFNSGIKFKLQNLKSRYESLINLWRKIESLL